MKKKCLWCLLPLFLFSCASEVPSSSSHESSSSFSIDTNISLPPENARLLQLDSSFSKTTLVYDASEVHYLPLPRVTSEEWFLAYQNIGRYDDGFLTLKNGGCLYNPYQNYGTHGALPGIKNIVVEYDAIPGESLLLSYGWSEDYLQEAIPLSSGVSFDFYDQDPGYFKLYASSHDPIYIRSITLRFMGQIGTEPKSS